MKGLSSLLNLLLGTSQDFFDDKELPWRLEILQAEVTENAPVSNVSEIPVKRTVFEFHALATPAKDIKGTIWGLYKPFELTLNASDTERGRLVVTNKTSGLSSLPIDDTLHLQQALLLSIREEGQNGSGVFIIPIGMFTEDIEAVMESLIQSISIHAAEDDDLSKNEDIASEEGDLLDYFHLVIFLFGENYDLAPDTEETYASLEEAFIRHNNLKSLFGARRAA